MIIKKQEELTKLLYSIREVYGYDFTEYAEASVIRRINLFMTNHSLTTVAALTDLILGDRQQFEEFIRAISVTVTEMFRDPVFYRQLRKLVIPRLATYPVIKIWIAGCATGEEVYSVSIILKEAGLLGRSIIYATDINQHSLQQAKDGIFPIGKMKEYTLNYQKSGGEMPFSDYYTSKYNVVKFNSELSQNLVFSVHNLTMDKSFNEFQLILCRNVLIYFNQQLQRKVIDLFFESLCPFGILALGNKESLLFSNRKSDFEELDKRERIYIKSK
jgi:chemotaxis protein methyltransferase CheR